MTRNCNLCKLQHETGECPARLIGKRSGILSIPASAVAARNPNPVNVEKGSAAEPFVSKVEPTPASAAPDGYTAGTVVRLDLARQFLIIESDNKTWRAGLDDVSAPGRHYCLFQLGTPVLFRKAGESAVDVRIDAPVELPFEETAIIISWCKTYGFAKRQCGCPIFVPGNSLSTKRDEVEVGTMILYQLIDLGQSSRTAGVELVSAAA